MNVFLTDSDVVLVVNPSTEDKQRATRSVTIGLVNANTASHITGLDKLPGKVNYFYGNTPKHWHTNIPIYEMKPFFCPC